MTRVNKTCFRVYNAHTLDIEPHLLYVAPPPFLLLYSSPSDDEDEPDSLEERLALLYLFMTGSVDLGGDLDLDLIIGFTYVHTIYMIQLGSGVLDIDPISCMYFFIQSVLKIYDMQQF